MCKIVTPVVTVFDEKEKPDYEGNKKVIDFLIEGGVDGILVLGSSGEFTGLTKQEKHDFFKFYADYTAGRTKLYAGTGSLNFEDTVALSNEVNEMGYEGAMVIGPCYYALDQEKIFVYYDMLAKSIKGNLYIYNFPARNGHSIAPETLKKLVENNTNIKGAEEYVFGYSVFNDLSSRDLQTRHGQWLMGKSLDNYTIMGPVIVDRTELPMPLELDIKSYVNGELRQNSNTKYLIKKIPGLIAELSKGITLEAGDIIATGTPAGVGMGFTPPRFLKKGDKVTCEIDRIGQLTNYIV